MADNTIATAYVQLTASAKGITDNISQELGGAGKKEGSNFGSTFLKGAGAALAAGATAIAGSVAALWKTASDTAAAGDEIAKTSTKLGVTTDQYQALAFAAEHCDFEVSSLLTAQRKLAESDFEGNLYDALNSVMALGTEEERTSAATKLFGDRAAQAMANLLNGSESLDMFQAELKGLGGLMSEDAVQASATFEDSLTNIKTAASGVVKELSAEMLPGITEVMDGLSAVFKGNSNAGSMLTAGINSIVTAFEGIIPKLVNVITTVAPAILSGGGQLLIALADGILAALPDALPVLMSVILGLAKMLLGMLPTFLTTGIQLVTELLTGIGEAIPTLLPLLVRTVLNMINALLENAPALLEALLTVVQAVADSLFGEVLPMILKRLPDIVDGICAFIFSTSDMVFSAVIQLVEAILSNLPQIIDLLVQIIPTIIVALCLSLIENQNLLLAASVQIVMAIVENLPMIIASLIKAIPDVVVSIVDAFEREFPEFVKVGWSIVDGLWKGLQDKWSGLLENCRNAAKSLIDQFKDFWGIASPSKVMAGLGGFLGDGLAIGIEDSAAAVDQAMDGLTSDLRTSVSADVTASGSYSAASPAVSTDSAVADLLSRYLPVIAAKDMTVEMNADASKMFDVMRKQNGVFKKANGVSAFA